MFVEEFEGEQGGVRYGRVIYAERAKESTFPGHIGAGDNKKLPLAMQGNIVVYSNNLRNQRVSGIFCR